MHKRTDGHRWRRMRADLKAQQQPCWLCGRDIDYSIPFPNPWAFTIDHIVPLAHGGHPEDRDNLKAAHYRCNQRKGDRMVPVKPARISFHTSRSW